MLFRSLLIALISALILTNSAVAEETERESHKIVGLTRILKKKRAHWYSLRAPRLYEYKLENTTKTLIIPKPLKRIPDLRKFGEKYPKLQNIHDGASWAYPIISLVWLTYPIWKGR